MPRHPARSNTNDNVSSHADIPGMSSFPAIVNASQGHASTSSLSRQVTSMNASGVTKACVPCREKKARCDMYEPCKNCSTRGEQDKCVRSSHLPRGGAAHKRKERTEQRRGESNRLNETSKQCQVDDNPPFAGSSGKDVGVPSLDHGPSVRRETGSQLLSGSIDCLQLPGQQWTPSSPRRLWHADPVGKSQLARPSSPPPRFDINIVPLAAPPGTPVYFCHRIPKTDVMEVFAYGRLANHSRTSYIKGVKVTPDRFPITIEKVVNREAQTIHSKSLGDLEDEVGRGLEFEIVCRRNHLRVRHVHINGPQDATTGLRQPLYPSSTSSSSVNTTGGAGVVPPSVSTATV